MSCEETNLSPYARRHAAFAFMEGKAIQGIDYIEVLNHDTPSDDLRWRILLVHLFEPIADVTKVELRITGGLESASPVVEWVFLPGALPDPLEIVHDQRGSRRALDTQERDYLNGLDSSGRTLLVHIIPRIAPVEDQATYTISLLTGDGEILDPRLARDHFSFHSEGPVENDCGPDRAIERVRPPTPPIDYLAKDYASFRRLMLDRMAVIMPAWNERSAADIGIALVELLAYAGDQLSYYQDAVATEAYLGTARRRTSVRRHARLLDYPLHEGNNARVWISLEVTNDLEILPGTQLITRLDGETSPSVPEDKLAYALLQGAFFFETMYPATLSPARNCIPLYDWSGSLTCLSQGATHATLACCKENLGLLPGDVLILEEINDSITGLQADQTRRHVVCVHTVDEVEDRLQRHWIEPGTSVPACYQVLDTDPTLGSLVCPRVTEVTWDMADALPFSLPIRHASGAQASVARGNVVLADHGRTVTEALQPETAAAKERYRPYLLGRNVTHRVPFDAQALRAQPARVQLTQDPRRALPVVAIEEIEDIIPCDQLLQTAPAMAAAAASESRDIDLKHSSKIRGLGHGKGNHDHDHDDTDDDAGTDTEPVPPQNNSDPLPMTPSPVESTAATYIERRVPWYPRRDLLASGPFERHVAIEVERDGRAQVRFGDNVNGRRPSFSSRWESTYRLGNGSIGNIGAEALAHVVVPHDNAALNAITVVRNPLPAEGGTEPERDQQARLYAPYTFRQGERAVTADDYANIAERHPEVQKAVALLRWTGSWDTVFVVVDRRGGLPIDAAFEAELRSFLEPYRMAGQDLEFEPPIFVPLDIAMTVHVAPDYLQSEVKAALMEALSSSESATGKRGFFHPDNFSFGDPVYLSSIVATAMKVSGVVWVDMSDDASSRNRFQRLGEPPQGEIGEGRIVVGPLEIIRVDNDPRAPQNGRIQLFMEGGL